MLLWCALAHSAACLRIVLGSFACQALVDALTTDDQISELTSAISLVGRQHMTTDQLERAHDVMRQAGISLSPSAAHSVNGSAPSLLGSALSLELHHLCTNASGHFVVLRLLARLPSASLSLVDTCMARHCRVICCDHHGLRVVKAYLAARPAEALDAFYGRVVDLCTQLVEDGYGNCNRQQRTEHCQHNTTHRSTPHGRPCHVQYRLRM